MMASHLTFQRLKFAILLCLLIIFLDISFFVGKYWNIEINFAFFQVDKVVLESPDIDEGFVNQRVADARFKLTYDTYLSPIIEAWPPEKNRSIPLYLRPNEDTVISDTTCLNLEETRLLIIVKSYIGNEELRSVTRNTYMTFTKKYPYVSVIHLMGRTLDPNLEQRLQAEVEQFCDIVQMDFIEHYHNLTLKSVSALKLVLASRVFNKKRLPNYLLVVDDDSYVNIPILWFKLFSQSSLPLDTKQLYGYLEVGGLPNRDPDSKWYCPRYLYNGKAYPEYLPGFGYLLPRDTWRCLYREALGLPYYHIEDLFITGFAAERCGFRRVDFGGFIRSEEMENIKDLNSKKDVVFSLESSNEKIEVHRLMT